MFEQYLIKINEAITQPSYIAYIAAFLWGICSVIFSPCHLASIPLIIGYICGFTEIKKLQNAFWYSLVFVISLFFSIAVIGIITAIIGQIIGQVGKVWNYVIGVIMIFIALHLFGIIPLNIPRLTKLQTKKRGFTGAFLLGLTYGIVSGPCTFGFIAPMLSMVTLQKTMLHGVILIVLFSIGHCIPILIGGTTTSFACNIINSSKLQRSGLFIKKISAVIFLIIAFYIIFK